MRTVYLCSIASPYEAESFMRVVDSKTKAHVWLLDMLAEVIAKGTLPYNLSRNAMRLETFDKHYNVYAMELE